jgi:tetratricopeptide (TPR) repeat protein/tRNA A-37 threonylcarbamoyl transferase component Bud32
VPGYEILGELGRGGMGIVFKARHVRLHRVVALKMILFPSQASTEDRLRFRSEAELAAQLHHPNIVQIYEVGETECGPYIALEYVEGGSLAELLRGGPQPPRQAAELIEALASAMQHAHERGIVHRDLKPANVLLAACGLAGEGAKPQAAVAKITDFGLAKNVEGTAGLTRTGEVLGTPNYMSPEQARGQPDAIGLHTDVYALGAVLYECLAGVPPFRGLSIAETLLRVQACDPVPPTRLQPGIPRDLETICLKCLEKEPRRRYPSAGALAEDLGRFRAGQPIRARPVGALERGWKWARRRPAVATLLAVSLAAGLVLLVGGWWSYLAVLGARDREAQQRRRAEDRLRDALDVVDRLLTEVAEIDLDNVPQMEPVRRTLLKKAQQYYEKFLRDGETDPAVHREAGRALVRLGDIQEFLGDRAEAESSYTRATALLSSLAEEHPEVPVYRQDLARAWHALAVLLRKTNRFDEAEKAGRQATGLLGDLTEQHPDEPAFRRDLAATFYDRGALLARLRGRQREAEKAYRESLQQQEELARRFPREAAYRRDLARTLNNLGILLQRMGQPEAETTLTRAVRLQQELVEEAPRAVHRWELARSWTNLGVVQRGRFPDRADHSYQEAQRLLGGLRADFPTVPIYRQELAAVHSNRGWLFQQRGRWAQAEKAFEEALSLRRQLTDLPDDRHRLADTLVKKGFVLGNTARPRQAEPFYREALAIQGRLVADYPRVHAYRNARGATLTLLAGLLTDRGHFREREQQLSLAARAAWGTPLHQVEPILEAQAALREARQLLDLAIADHREVLHADKRNLFYRQCLRNDHDLLVLVLLRLGEPAAAAAHAEELPRLFPAVPAEHVHAARLLAECAGRAELRKPDLARQLGGRAVELLEKAQALGFRDKNQLRSSWPAYAPLRSWDDFQKLLQHLGQ